MAAVAFLNSLADSPRLLASLGNFAAPNPAWKLNGLLASMATPDGVPLIEKLNALGGKHGIGRIDHVAFVVSDEHQGRGIGTVLLEHLAAAAREAFSAARAGGFGGQDFSAMVDALCQFAGIEKPRLKN